MWPAQPTHRFSDLVPEGQVVASAPDPHAELEYHVLAGEMAVQRGDRARAAEEYVAALEYSSDPDLAQRATRIALFAGKPDLAHQAAEAWAREAPASADAQKTAARLALRMGAHEQLASHAASILQLHAKDPGPGFLELADVLSGEPQHAGDALEVMRAQASQHTDLAEAHYALSLLAFRYDRFDLADEAVQAALARRPQWNDAVLLRAGILVHRDQVAEADKLVASLHGSARNRADNQLAYARMLLDADKLEAAADAFEQALTLQPDDTDARYGLGLLALSMQDYGRAEKAFKTLYDNGHRRNDAAYYLGAIAAAREDYGQARSWYQRVKGGSHAFDAKVRAARALYEKGDLDAARAELQTLRENHPDLRERLYAAEGQMLYDAGRYQQALTLYNEALDKSPGDSDLLYGRSLIYERLGKIEDAEADLRTILDREPDDTRALNALGYMLSNHSQRYQEALGYIRQALQANPEDPAVIDSMGWVQYRLGHLQKAKAFLKRAYDKFPDPEVAAHLGEVLWQLGDRDKARHIWRQALAEHPQHPVLRETVERFTQ